MFKPPTIRPGGYFTLSISLNRYYVLLEVKGPDGLALRPYEPFHCVVSSQKD